MAGNVWLGRRRRRVDAAGTAPRTHSIVLPLGGRRSRNFLRYQKEGFRNATRNPYICQLWKEAERMIRIQTTDRSIAGFGVPN